MLKKNAEKCTVMKKKIQLFPSGISLADNEWGGFYKGGTYLLVGPRKSGRTILGLQYTQECIRQKEICLYFTNMRPKELMIHAASIDFDLQKHMNQNQVVVVRVSNPSQVKEKNKSLLSSEKDELLNEYLNDIISIVNQYHPDKIVFDELTPYVEFDDIDRLKDVFLNVTENIEEAGITSLFILGEPATPGTKKIVDSLSENSTGVILLQKKEKEERQKSGVISIIPNIGHTEGRFDADYILEPYRGIVIKEAYQAENKKEENKYTFLSELEIPEDAYSSLNVYTPDDFSLILNNQIAVYKSSGLSFTVVAFRLDPSAEEERLLTINQLQNAVRLSLEKKDKISVINNKVIVLLIKEEQKDIINLVAKVKSNLPSTEQEYQNKLMKYISVYSVQMRDNINSSNDILNELLFDERHDKTNYR